MLKKNVGNGEAIGSGCIVSVGALVFFFAPLIYSPYILALPFFIIVASPSAIIGALLGKYFTKTRWGTWVGAIIGAVIGYFLFFWVVSATSFS